MMLNPSTAPPREIVVVTGAPGGIGRAAARAFARPGARIASLVRGERGLSGAKREVESLNAEALALPTDMSDWRQVQASGVRLMSESTMPW